MGGTGSTPVSQSSIVVERLSDRELAVTRVFDAPRSIVFDAWTTPALFRQWWVPKSMPVPLLACEMDVRTDGTYRLEFGHASGETFVFFGKYLEVTPDTRIVWTNDEAEAGAVTTVTFAEETGTTLLVLHERYPTPQARDAAIAGLEGAAQEQFAQLDTLLEDLTRTRGL